MQDQSSRATSPPTGGDDSSFSAAFLLRVARKQLLLLVACWLAVLTTVFFWTLGQTRTFRAESNLRLDPEPPRPLGQRVELVNASQGGYWNRREFYETELRIMRSRRVAVATVQALGLHADPGFLMVKPSDRASFKPIAVEDAADVLIGRLSAEWIKESSMAVIRYEDTDPARCQTVLNTLVRIYLAQNLENTASMSTTALSWLNGQLEHLKVDLEKSEVALSDFRQKHNVLSLSFEDRHNIIAQQLDAISREVTAVEIKRIAAASRVAELNAVAKSKDPMQVGAAELLASQVLNTLRTAYSQQQRDLDELSSSLGDNHPKVVAARAKLNALTTAIFSEIDNIKKAAQGDLKSLDRQLGDLHKKDEGAQALAHELQGFETPYNQLVRTKINNEKIYGLVLERARETDLTRVMNFNNIRVVDEAIRPKAPFRPNVPLNLAVGAVAGLLMGIAMALARELSDRSLKTPAEVESLLGVTCIGLLPEIEEDSKPKRSSRRRPGDRRNPTTEKYSDERDLIVAVRPDSGVAEAARAIRTNLSFMRPDKPPRTLLVTSAVPEEGKTTVACSLAIVLAQSGHRVLLVDTDLRRPRLHRTFKIPNDVGVTIAFARTAPIEECIHKTEFPNLYVMPSGPIPPNPAELLQSERFHEFAKDLASRFDRIVYDSPPILPVTDAAILAQTVDGAVMVARGFKTQKSAVRQAVRHLTDVKAPLLGVVLNAIDLRRHDYREYHYYYRREGYYGPRENPEDDSDSASAPH